jgi:signal peptidase I
MQPSTPTSPTNTTDHTPDAAKPTDHQPTPQKPKSNKLGRFGNFLGTVGLILLAPLIALFLTAFVFQTYQVDGVSMQNTLQNNDRLIVWKLPRTWAKITGHQYVPKRGDIVIASESGLSRYGDSPDTKQIVKRVIGLPGDRVTYKNGAYEVFNKAHQKGFDPDTTLPYGQNDSKALFSYPGSGDTDVTLGSDQIFVSGDHRADSLDSRTFGPIKTSQVIGKLVMRILPLSQAERF